MSASFRRRLASLGCLFGACCAVAVGCGDSLDISPVGDAGAPEASVHDAATSDAAGPLDAATDARDASDASPDSGPPSYALLTYDDLAVATPSQHLVALNLTTGEMHDTPWPGSVATTAAGADAPWLLGQDSDLVAKLDAREPWKIVSTWDVRLDDRPDGGSAAAGPAAILEVAGASKAYVLRFLRNRIAVLDTSQQVDAGAPVKTIDLSAFVQPNDTDGTVEPIAAFLQGQGHELMYVLLAGIDRNKTRPDGKFLCADTTPLLIGIDVSTDALIPFQNANGPNGSYRLAGYAPTLDAQFGRPSVIFDSRYGRLLVLSTGCYEALADGGAGAASRRLIEQIASNGVELGVVQTRIDLSATEPAPKDWSYIGLLDALIGIGPQVVRWDSLQAKVGPVFATTPGGGDGEFRIANAGGGDVILSNAVFASGKPSFEVYRAHLADGGNESLFASSGAPTGAVTIWPKVP